MVDVIEDGHSAGTLKLDRWSNCLRVSAGSWPALRIWRRGPVGDEKESNLPPSGNPSRRAAAGTVLQGHKSRGGCFTCGEPRILPPDEAVHPLAGHR